jgi:hypothetical protein
VDAEQLPAAAKHRQRRVAQRALQANRPDRLAFPIGDDQDVIGGGQMGGQAAMSW